MSGVQQLLFTHGAQQSETFEALPTAGATTNFVVPVGVTSISVYAVGGGGGGGFQGGAGGGLVWTDGVPVTAGETLIVGVGTGGHPQRLVVGGNPQPNGTSSYGRPGTTSYVKRQSNNEFIVKAFGGGGDGGIGGEGMFFGGTGMVNAGGDAYNYSAQSQTQTPQYQWQQGANTAYKGRSGGGGYNNTIGAGGVAIKPGTTGEAGDSGSNTANGSGGEGGLYGGGGGGRPAGNSATGGWGADGGIRISWDTPVDDGVPYINGRYSVQFKGKYYYQYLQVVPAESDYFQLGNSDWTMECWWRPYQGAPNQSYWGQGNHWQGSPFIEGVDANGITIWKMGAGGGGSNANTPLWYHKNSGQAANEHAILRWYQGGDQLIDPTSDTWRHICFMRNGNMLYLYMNGTAIHQYSGGNGNLFQFADMANFNDTSTATINIGGSGELYSGEGSIAGLISNVRLTKGRCLYLNDYFGANQSGPLTQLDGTVLIACNGPTVDSVTFGLDDTSVVGQEQWTTPGTYSWTCPDDVTSVCAVAIGGGGGGGGTATGANAAGGIGGTGGGLGWKNNISVTPGQSYTVVVGAGGASNGGPGQDGGDGQDSYFIDATTVKGGGASGGKSGNYPNNQTYSGGDYVGDGGGDGGGAAASVYAGGSISSGGGGAGGYSGSGGRGGNSGTNASTGSGGAGGGGGGSYNGAGGGGGTWLEGEGNSGGGYPFSNPGDGGYGGSNSHVRLSTNSGDFQGNPGTTSTGRGGDGGKYGGGGGGDSTSNNGGNGSQGGSGAVRIMWGSGRSFPSTNAENKRVVNYGYNSQSAPNAYVSTPEDPQLRDPVNDPTFHPFDYTGGVT